MRRMMRFIIIIFVAVCVAVAVCFAVLVLVLLFVFFLIACSCAPRKLLRRVADPTMRTNANYATILIATTRPQAPIWETSM